MQELQFFVIGKLIKIGAIDFNDNQSKYGYIVWDTSHGLSQLFLSVSITNNTLKSGNFYKIKDAVVKQYPLVYNKHFDLKSIIQVTSGNTCLIPNNDVKDQFTKLTHEFLQKLQDDINKICKYNEGTFINTTNKINTSIFNGVRNLFSIYQQWLRCTILVKILDLDIVRSTNNGNYAFVFKAETEGRRFNIIKWKLQHPNLYRTAISLINKEQIAFFCNASFSILNKNNNSPDTEYFMMDANTFIIYDICKPLLTVVTSPNINSLISYIWPHSPSEYQENYIYPHIHTKIFNQLRESYNAARYNTDKTVFTLLSTNIINSHLISSNFKYKCMNCKKIKAGIEGGCCGSIPDINDNIWYEAMIKLKWNAKNKEEIKECKINSTGIFDILTYLLKCRFLPETKSHENYIKHSEFYQKVIQQEEDFLNDSSTDKFAFAINYFFEIIKQDKTIILEWLIRKNNSSPSNTFMFNTATKQYSMTLNKIQEKQMKMDNTNNEMENIKQLSDTITDNNIQNCNTDNYNTNTNSIRNNNIINNNTNNIGCVNTDNYNNKKDINNTNVITNKKRKFSTMISDDKGSNKNDNNVDDNNINNNNHNKNNNYKLNNNINPPKTKKLKMK